MALNPIIYLKIINNIMVFQILKKYYRKIAMQLLTPIWHVIQLQPNNPLEGENVTIDSGEKNW